MILQGEVPGYIFPLPGRYQGGDNKGVIMLVRRFYHLAYIVTSLCCLGQVVENLLPNKIYVPEFIHSRRLRNRDPRGSSLAKDYAEIKNLRAFYTQEKVEHAGYRLHAHHAQKGALTM